MFLFAFLSTCATCRSGVDGIGGNHDSFCDGRRRWGIARRLAPTPGQDRLRDSGSDGGGARPHQRAPHHAFAHWNVGDEVLSPRWVVNHLDHPCGQPTVLVALKLWEDWWGVLHDVQLAGSCCGTKANNLSMINHTRNALQRRELRTHKQHVLQRCDWRLLLLGCIGNVWPMYPHDGVRVDDEDEPIRHARRLVRVHVRQSVAEPSNERRIAASARCGEQLADGTQHSRLEHA